MRRIAVERVAIRLLQGDDPARTAQPDRLADEPLGIARGARQEAHVDEIETAVRQIRRIGVALPEFDVRRGVGTRVLEELRILVQSDHAAGATRAPAHRLGDSAGAASEIDA